MIKKKWYYYQPFYLLTLLTFLMFFMFGCGRSETPSDSASIMQSQIIIGDLDWQLVKDISDTTVKQHAKAVGIVYLPAMGSRCTGFLVAPDVVMTNHHCVPSESYAAGAEVAFNKTGEGQSEVKYNCSEFIGNHSELDFALLRCQGSPGQTYGTVRLATTPFGEDGIYVVQQNCDYYTTSSCTPNKIVSFGQVTDAQNSSGEYTHNADTLGGSSGSPVFSQQNNTVIAIHHAGRGNNGDGRGIENYAVPMWKIVEVIQSDYPFILNGSTDAPDDPTPTPDEPSVGNSFTTATDVSTQLGTTVNSLAIDSKEEDFFQVTFQGEGKFKVQIDFSHQQGDLDLKVFDLNQQQVAKSESVTNSESIEIEVSSGTYYVKVFGYNGATGSYSLSTSFESYQQANNTQQTATSISVPFSSTREELKSNDTKDFFKFTLTTSQKVNFKITFQHSFGDLDLFIMDSNGTRVGYSNGVSDTEQVSKTLAAGEYFVLIEGYRGATGKYSLNID